METIMGDRANCIVQENGSPDLYLYTHWGGYQLVGNVQTALKRQVRWDDPSYLARIIFDQMSLGDQGDETGYGISTVMGDGDDQLVFVDTHKQEIRIGEQSWSFGAFCKADVSGIAY